MLGILLVLSFGAAEQLTPIPNKLQEGYVLGTSNATYTIDAYFDHLCSDSAAAYPSLLAYWQDNSSWLRLVIHIFPLPYHYNAFWVTQAGRFIQTSYPDRFLNFTSYFFNHQSTYLTTALSWTFPQIAQQIANDTSAATGVPASQVTAALNDDDLNWSTRVSWKFACSNEVTGTPQYFINGVSVPDVAGYTSYGEWKKFFTNLN
jgi:hypothetical protein